MPRTLYTALATVALASLALVGCAPASQPAPGATQSESDGGTEVAYVDGRGVSASETEIVIRTEEGEQTFQLRPEDVAAVDPEHFNSHVGVETLGYRVYFITADGVDYAVSVEEIDGTTLGFD